MSEQFKKSEQPFEPLVRALQEGEARRLSQCLEEIDRRLLNCHKSLDEYRKIRGALRTINNQLSLLGAEPLSVVSDELPVSDLSEIIKSRIEHFKTEGKV